MTLGDLAALVGYGMGAFVLGWGVGALLHAVRKFFEQV